jgi:drug/metabolite transporter (DMT)-like permease
MTPVSPPPRRIVHPAATRRENLRGAAISVAASLGFTAVSIMVKQLGLIGIDAFQTVFVRTFFGMAIIVPLMVAGGVAPWRTAHIRIHASRAVLGGFSVIFGYYAFTKLPLAEVTAISFTVPLFVTILAVFLLREDVRWRRWSATAVGFAGVLLVARPFDHAPQLATLLAVAMAFCVGLSVVLLKTFPKKESQLLMLFYFLVVSGLMAAGPALAGWQAPDLQGWLLLAGVGVLATGSQALIIKAFRIGDASFVAPFDYVRLLFAGAAGFLMFAEVPDTWTYAGSVLIVGSTLYIAHREARARRG